MKKLLAFLSLCMVLTGCSGSGEDSDKFVVGMECNYAPYNYQTSAQTDSSVSLGGAGYCDGYDVMVSQKIADALGKELEIKKLDWDGLAPALDNGAIDAIIAGMTADEKREAGIDFTTPYYDSDMVLIVRKDDALVNATNIQDFSGKHVIGQLSTNYDSVIDQIEGVTHMTPKSAYPDMVIALKSKDADAITAEIPVAKGVIAANPDLAYVVFSEGNGFMIDNSISIGLKEGTRGSETFKKIQAALDTISQDMRMDMMKKAVENAPTGA